MTTTHKFVPGIASQSLGNPQYHGIKRKLRAARSAGMESMEIFFEDIAQLARAYQSDNSVIEKRFRPSQPQRTEWEEAVLAGARQIGQWCRMYSLAVICLQPMMHTEGCLDPKRRADNMHRLELWMEIATSLGTDLIQVPSNFLPATECTSDRGQIVADLKQVAQIGAQHTPVIRFAYEGLCWGTHVNTWDAAWEIVKAVDMDNFGTCLDTFNISGRVYADPESVDGCVNDAEQAIRRSMNKLLEVFSQPENLRKVFYVELCDGERLDQPMSQQHQWYNAEQGPRMTWSRNARLFAFETQEEDAVTQSRRPGYLPVWEIFATLVDLGFEGFVAFEVFNRSLNQPDAAVVKQHAERAHVSWQRVLEKLDEVYPARITQGGSSDQISGKLPVMSEQRVLGQKDMPVGLIVQPRL